ncbi:MAG TPA: winged helix-turn-helix domain-containing protein [Woeseiaceae bacterium]|nr:winged helix-turn-helix domain-containing protein [Woeseiaceae bacterium]
MIYRFESFTLDTDRFELRDAGEPVILEPQVLALIALLVENRDRMVSKDELIEVIWNGRIVSESAISSRIKKARRALRDSGNEQRLIRTVHGKGFRFVGESVGAESDSPSPTPAVPSITAGTSARPRVVILPFANLSGDPDQEYFSDAITQDLITNLSKHRWIEVVARNSAFGYKGKPVDWQQLVDELGVSYIVEGSVRRAGDRIRATAQLVDAISKRQIWADRYDRDLEDVFAVQDEITAKIAARLEPEIGAFERRKVTKTPPRDLRAWDCYHLGIARFFKFTADDNLEAQRLLQKSRELDPRFGEAHAWWAYAVILGMVYWDTEPTTELLDAALAATQRALQLDDQNAVFYALKARVQLARCEYQSALIENNIAIELNPTFAAAYCGLADSLAYEGHYEESIRQFEHALELSPNDPQRWAFLTYGALAHIFKGDYPTALEWTDRAGEIPNCQFWTHAHRAVALAYLGKTDEARHEIEQVKRERPQFSIEFARNKLFFIKDKGQLDGYLEGLRRAGVPATS